MRRVSSRLEQIDGRRCYCEGGFSESGSSPSIGEFRRSVVDRFAEAQFQFFQPAPRVKTVNESAQKTEPFGHVAPVVANVVLRNTSAYCEKARHVNRLRGHVSRVA